MALIEPRTLRGFRDYLPALMIPREHLLEKVQHHGLAALSDEERRFLKRVSDKYRNRP